jgi:molybdopterin synthase catalytic subunit
MTHLVDEPIDVAALVDETRDPTCGALVVFEGMVRDHDQDESVASMTYTAYRPLAERVLAELETEACQRFDVARCRVVHRLGWLGMGESSVAVVVRAAHRAPAYDASRFVIDALKERAPIWKQDHLRDGSTRYQDGTPLADPAAGGE